MKKIFFVSLLLFSIAKAQNNDSKIIAAETVTIHSAILNEDRKLFIYKPSENDIYAPADYPVIYLLDGEAQTRMVAGQVSYLSESYPVIPKMIVVGIGNTNRTRDLTPNHSNIGFDGKPDTSANPFGRNSGGGEHFLQFIQQEVMPYVEKNYHPAPYKIFSGHSLGGLMMFYCLLARPEMFNAYIAISPSLFWDKQWTIRQAADKWKPGMSLNKILFFSDGNEGGQFHTDALGMDSLLAKNKLQKLKFKYIYYPEESHISEPVKAFYDGIRFVFPDWFPQQANNTDVLKYSFFEKYYDTLSKKYGYTIKPPEEAINSYGYNLLQLNKIDEALIFFKKNTENYPQSYNTYDSYGEALMIKGDKANSIINYKKSLELNPKNDGAKGKLKTLQH
ncbi:MAG: alpha/beta hydrolase-fold protein [Ginsengibacter sp.]